MAQHGFEQWAHQYIPTAGYGQWGAGAATYAPSAADTGMPSIPGWKGTESITRGKSGGGGGGGDWKEIYMPMMWEIEHLSNSSSVLHAMLRIVISHTLDGGVRIRLVTNTARTDPGLEENQRSRNAAAHAAARHVVMDPPSDRETAGNRQGLDDEDRAEGSSKRPAAPRAAARGQPGSGGDGPRRSTQFTTPWFEREVVEAYLLPAARDSAEHILKYGLYVIVYGEVSLSRGGTRLVVPRVARPHEYVIKRRRVAAPVKRGMRLEYKAVFKGHTGVRSRVFVVHEPDAMGIITSAIRRVYQPLRTLHAMIDNLAIADHDRSRQSVIQNPVPVQKGSLAETDGTTTMGAVLEHRVNYRENEAAEVRLAHVRAGEQPYEDAKQAFALKRQMDRAAAAGGSRGLKRVGNAMAEGALGANGSNVPPRVSQENLLIAPAGTTWQAVAQTTTDAGWNSRAEWLVQLIGQAIGVSPEWIKASSSQHAAGAHMARKHLSTMVSELQQALRPQLTAQWYDMYGDSMDVYRVQRRAVMRRTHGGKGAVDWDDAPAVVYEFNSLPQMTPEIMKDMMAMGIVGWDTFSDMMLRFNNLPARAEAIAPSAQEMEKIMLYVRGEKQAPESADQKAEQAAE
jgi:hypothetical protein